MIRHLYARNLLFAVLEIKLRKTKIIRNKRKKVPNLLEHGF